MQQQMLYLIPWAALSFWTLGQIWFVQVVIYPLFAQVGEADYVAYHRFYSRRIPLVVILPGFDSFLLPLPLAWLGPDVPLWMSVTNVAAGIVGLLVTALLAIPRHARLEKGGKNPATITELVRCNWPRTAAISVQAVVTVLMLVHVSARA